MSHAARSVKSHLCHIADINLADENPLRKQTRIGLFLIQDEELIHKNLSFTCTERHLRLHRIFSSTTKRQGWAASDTEPKVIFNTTILHQ